MNYCAIADVYGSAFGQPKDAQDTKKKRKKKKKVKKQPNLNIKQDNWDSDFTTNWDEILPPIDIPGKQNYTTTPHKYANDLEYKSANFEYKDDHENYTNEDFETPVKKKEEKKVNALERIISKLDIVAGSFLEKNKLSSPSSLTDLMIFIVVGILVIFLLDITMSTGRNISKIII